MRRANSSNMWGAAASACAVASVCAGQVTLLSETPTAEGYFGAAVALSDDFLVVSAPGGDAVYTFDRATLGAATTLLRPFGEEDPFTFGGSLAIVGEKIVVGSGGSPVGRADGFDALTGVREHGMFPGPANLEAWGQATAGSEQAFLVGRAGIVGEPGSVVGVYDPITFFGQRVLTPDSPAPGAFGASVAINGGVAIVGSPGHPGRTTDFAGRVFLMDVATGTELGSFIAPDALPGDRFGTVIATDGDLAVVGAKRFDGAQHRGAVYVMDLTTPEGPLRIRPDDGGALWEFGGEVAVGGRIVAASSKLDTTLDGQVHLFDALTGRELAIVTPSHSSSADSFGDALAMHGSMLVIGAPHNDEQAQDAGAVHVYTFSEGALLADVDSSGVVDSTDLAVLLAAWGSDEALLDLNSDGAVNAADLAIMLAAWGEAGL